MDSSILVKKHEISTKKEKSIELVIRKCKCRHNWCKVCGKDSIKRAVTHMRGLDRERTRSCEFSIDPKNFNGARDAMETIRKKGRMSVIVRELVRLGVPVTKAVWVIEWHRNAMPHFHVMIEVRDKGKKGMIGGDTLRKAWKFGAVFENYIHSKQHWDNKLGYLHKNGYFQSNKGHQTQLPDIYMDDNITIRRYGVVTVKKEGEVEVKHIPTTDFTLPEWSKCSEHVRKELQAGLDRAEEGYRILAAAKEAKDTDEEPNEEKRTNREILEACGEFSEVGIILGYDSMGYVKGVARLGLFRFTLKQWRDFGATFRKGFGHVITLSLSDFDDLCSRYRQLPLWD